MYIITPYHFEKIMIKFLICLGMLLLTKNSIDKKIKNKEINK